MALSYFVMNFYWGGTLMAGISVLFNPMREAFGLSTTATAAAIQMRQGGAAIGSPLVGYLFDRVGPRPLMLAATVTTAGGMALLATAHSVLLFFVSFAIASIGFAIFIAGTGPAAMATWFVRQRGKAISIILAAGGIGALLVPVIVWMEGEWGWRTALWVMVIGLLVVGIPASLLLRHCPEQYGLRPDGDPPDAETPRSPASPEEAAPASAPWDLEDFTFAEAMRSKAFWLLTVGHGVTAFGTSSAMLLIFPHLEDQGFGRATVGIAVTVMSIVGVVSTLFLGWLSDRVQRLHLIVGSYVLQGVGLALLAFVSSTWSLIPFVVLFGIGMRSANPIVSALQADFFGVRSFGKIQGVMFSVLMVGSTVGPLLAAVVRDTTGSYASIFIAYAGVTVLAIVLVSMVRRPQRPSAPDPATMSASRRGPPDL